MKISINKEELSNIDQANIYLMENPQNKEAITMIEESLKQCFGCDFTVKVVSPSSKDEMFVMCVYPDETTMDKIIKAMVSDQKSSVIEKLWKENKIWTIEIDDRIFGKNPKCTEKELTAMMLHEVGHVVVSNKVTSRLTNIFRYEIAKASIGNKVIMKNKLFSGIMSLPILSACAANEKGSNINEEIKADNFVRKAGYQKDLISALQKFASTYSDADKSVKNATNFSMETIDNFAKRRDALVKKNIFSVESAHTSPYIRDIMHKCITNIYDSPVYENGPEHMPIDTLKALHDNIDTEIEASYYAERPDFLKKKLKKITSSEIDYAVICCNNIKSEDDRLMALSYARYKQDLVNYYLKIIRSETGLGKFHVPNSEPELVIFRNALDKAVKTALTYIIPKVDKNLVIQWAPGYEG